MNSSELPFSSTWSTCAKAICSQFRCSFSYSALLQALSLARCSILLSLQPGFWFKITNARKPLPLLPILPHSSRVAFLALSWASLQCSTSNRQQENRAPTLKKCLLCLPQALWLLLLERSLLRSSALPCSLSCVSHQAMLLLPQSSHSLVDLVCVSACLDSWLLHKNQAHA